MPSNVGDKQDLLVSDSQTFASYDNSSTETPPVFVGLLKYNLILPPKEREYVRHGGVLHYVLRQLAAESKEAS